MNVLEFAKAQRRMCATYLSCKGCPLQHGYCLLSADPKEERDEEIISIVEAWGKENPAKTRQSEFLKLFPNAKLDSNGVLQICIEDIDGNFKCPADCASCRKRYWLKEIE